MKYIFKFLTNVSVFTSCLYVVFISTLIAGCDKTSSDTAEVSKQTAANTENLAHDASTKPVPVLVTEVTTAPNFKNQTFNGTVVARSQTPLSFRVSGKVDIRYVDEGDVVQAGQVIARLDGSDYQLAAAAAKAQVQAATAQAEQAARDAARLKTLVTDGTVSRSEYENLTAKTKVAGAQTAAAKQELKLNQNKLKYLNLIAPASGVISQLNLEPGQVVGEGMPVGQLSNQNQLEVAVDLPADITKNIANWHASASLWHSADVVYDDAIPLKLRTVATTANPVGQNYTARYRLPSDNLPKKLGLKMGMSLSVTLSKPINEQQPDAAVFILPAGSVLKTDGAPFVWRVDGDKLMRTPVTVLRYEGEDVWLTGLNTGQKIVSVGAQKLTEHTAVRAVVRDSI